MPAELEKWQDAYATYPANENVKSNKVSGFSGNFFISSYS